MAFGLGFSSPNDGLPQWVRLSEWSAITGGGESSEFGSYESFDLQGQQSASYFLEGAKCSVRVISLVFRSGHVFGQQSASHFLGGAECSVRVTSLVFRNGHVLPGMFANEVKHSFSMNSNWALGVLHTEE